MMYKVIYSKDATRDLRKLDAHVSTIIYNWIDKNLQNCANPRALGGPLSWSLKGYWKYRVGDYRLVADIQDDIILIEIINVGHRREVYD